MVGNVRNTSPPLYLGICHVKYRRPQCRKEIFCESLRFSLDGYLYLVRQIACPYLQMKHILFARENTAC